MDGEASRLIEQLGLTTHPEGGHYREFFRSTVVLTTARGTRSAGRICARDIRESER